MRVEDGHAHAHTSYDLLSLKHYFYVLVSAVQCKLGGYKSLTVHLPFEIQHKEVKDKVDAIRYIRFGEFVKIITRIKLYWENAPWLNYGTWDLKYGNTDWSDIPDDIELCLDTGHLMLGSKDKKEFHKQLNRILDIRGNQIKHLHVHENDLVTDKHTPVPGKIIDKKLFESLIKNRSYIIEKGE